MLPRLILFTIFKYKMYYYRFRHVCWIVSRWMYLEKSTQSLRWVQQKQWSVEPRRLPQCITGQQLAQTASDSLCLRPGVQFFFLRSFNFNVILSFLFTYSIFQEEINFLYTNNLLRIYFFFLYRIHSLSKYGSIYLYS